MSTEEDEKAFYEELMELASQNALEICNSNPLNLKQRVKVLLDVNKQYKELFMYKRNHMKFKLYTDKEIGFPSSNDKHIIDTVSILIIIS